jgi:hypothetical protein
MQSKQLVLLDSLRYFYAQPENAEKLVKCIGFEEPGTHVSLRLMDWLCTNYSKAVNLQYQTTGNRKFHVYMSYKACLRSFSKKHFDPFARRERIYWEIATRNGQKQVLHTTCAQLCFFRWAISNGVWDYALKNKALIEEHMNKSIKSKEGNSSSKRRKELSRNNTKTHFSFSPSSSGNGLAGPEGQCLGTQPSSSA